MREHMTRTLAAAILALLAVATPTSAETITWFASNQVVSVNPWADYYVGPGLTVGTPWTLTVQFDPSIPPLRTITPGCNQYSMGTSTLTLGPYSYTNSRGSIYTNAALPEVGCFGGLPEGPVGNITFWYGTAGWQTDDPEAWRIAGFGGITYAAYYDALVQDGTLPTDPTRSTYRGRYQGFEIENESPRGTLIYGGAVNFQRLDSQPAPVPEPTTMLLMGTGLAWIARRRIRR